MASQFLSVLSADVSGSARLFQKLPRDEAKHAVGRYEKRIAQVVEGFRGRLGRRGGSHLVAYFSDAADALQSAVEMQRRVTTLPPISGVPIGVKVGVCVGHSDNEMQYFREDGEDNAAVNLSQMAAPGQVLMSVPKRAQGFEWNTLIAHSQPGLALKSGNRQLGVFELDWKQFTVAQIRPISGDSLSPPTLLYLSGQGGQNPIVKIGPERPLVSIGRLRDCALVLHGEMCSREHARIERRGDRFFLVDLSSNGSFVLTADGREMHLRGKEFELHGRGRIGFGRPVAEAGQDVAAFSVGEPLSAAAPGG